ncbi:MAG: hypothetical protein IAF38_11305, partial [Bacteroidia bacterium]|nr:hypothetical protein [Bacteroidia bacterium]
MKRSCKKLQDLFYYICYTPFSASPMKKTLLSLAILLSASFLFSQKPVKQISNAEYDLLKSTGLLDASVRYSIFPDKGNNAGILPFTAKAISPSINPNSLSGCSCVIPLDATFSVAPFTMGVAPDYRNDDGSTNSIALPFNFCMYGTTYTSVFINNNGNVSFVSSSGVFSSTGFPNSTDIMIAPFWADVDTRNLASGLVHYKVTSTSLIVKWDSVGYYSQHVDKLCNFQLIISDGTDPIIPNGNNVAFCYGDMGWTTGDASNGIAGFEGVPSTVGVN